MKALVSGQASLALVFSQPRQIRRLDRTPTVYPASLDPLRLFDGCVDVVEYEVDREGDVDQLTERAWACDRATRLFLLLLAPDEDEQFLREYAEYAEELLQDEAVLNFVKGRMSCSPFATFFEINRVLAAAEQTPKTLALFQSLLNLQGPIRKVLEAYNRLDKALFGDEERRADLMSSLVREEICDRVSYGYRCGNRY